jgi:N-acetylmuramoyl-L-alanine amidase
LIKNIAVVMACGYFVKFMPEPGADRVVLLRGPAGVRRDRPCFFGLRCWISLLLAGGIGFCVAKAFQSGRPAGTLTAAGDAGDRGSTPNASALSIVIDPGHGGLDPGTVANGQLEKTWTLRVGIALTHELRRRGHVVEITRGDDSTVPLIDRSLQSNRRPRAAFVSIHFNAGEPEASGIECYYAWPKNPEVMARMNVVSGVSAGTAARDDRGRLLAEALLAGACAATGSKNRGVHNEPGYSVISRTQCPAVLVECGFLTHPAECRDIQSDAWRARLVRGLANGIESWLRTAIPSPSAVLANPTVFRHDAGP